MIIKDDIDVELFFKTIIPDDLWAAIMLLFAEDALAANPWVSELHGAIEDLRDRSDTFWKAVTSRSETDYKSIHH